MDTEEFTDAVSNEMSKFSWFWDGSGCTTVGSVQILLQAYPVLYVYFLDLYFLAAFVLFHSYRSSSSVQIIPKYKL